MKLFFKKLAVVSVMAFVCVICFGGWSPVRVVNDVAQKSLASTVNPVYQVGCPADSGIPAWECTTWTQQNNINNAFRTAINNSASTTFQSRVVDAGIEVGADGAFGADARFTVSASATRFAGSGPLATCVVAGTINASEYVTCRTITNYSDGDAGHYDGATGTEFQVDASPDTFYGMVGVASRQFPLKKTNGTYVTSYDVKCAHIDSGTTDVTIVCEMQSDEI